MKKAQAKKPQHQPIDPVLFEAVTQFHEVLQEADIELRTGCGRDSKRADEIASDISHVRACFSLLRLFVDRS
jgi:hypothetical protein